MSAIPVNDIIDKANFYFKTSANEAKLQRHALRSFVLELVLGNGYKGFVYLREDDVPKGSTFGITPDEDDGHTYPDETRIQFLK